MLKHPFKNEEDDKHLYCNLQHDIVNAQPLPKSMEEAICDGIQRNMDHHISCQRVHAIDPKPLCSLRPAFDVNTEVKDAHQNHANSSRE